MKNLLLVFKGHMYDYPRVYLLLLSTAEKIAATQDAAHFLVSVGRVAVFRCGQRIVEGGDRMLECLRKEFTWAA